VKSFSRNWRAIRSYHSEILANSLGGHLGEGVDFTLPPRLNGSLASTMAVDADGRASLSHQHGVSWFTDRRYAFDNQPTALRAISFDRNERELPTHGSTTRLPSRSCQNTSPTGTIYAPASNAKPAPPTR
jgi:hypothetical protein